MTEPLDESFTLPDENDSVPEKCIDEKFEDVDQDTKTEDPSPIDVEQGEMDKRKERRKRRKRRKIWKVIQNVGFGFLCIICAFTVWFKYQSDNKIQVAIANTTQNSNTSCPFWDITGDGYCDDKANIVECGYDFRDCCEYGNDRTLCTNCTCHLTEDKVSEIKNYACNSSVFFDELTSEKGGPGNHHLGNGFCDLMFNQDKYFFDIGDCCLHDEVSCRGIDGQTDKCPENTCILSNNFCIQEELGDGICQDHNNGPYCDYDLGDCCDGTSASECCACKCHERDLNYFG